MSEPDSSLIVRRKAPDLDLTELEAFQRELTRRLARNRPFTCLLTGDAEIRQLNRRFRGADHPTDVLSFPSGESSGYLGDIAISVDHARRQALQFGHSLTDEIKILMLHGVLHLLGMDHETDSGQMKQYEARWRRKLGLPAGLIERVEP